MTMTTANRLRIAFAGDRDIAVWVLQFILQQDVRPLALLLPDTNRASHSGQLRALCPHLKSENILQGKEFTKEKGIGLLKELNLDYVIGIHFPHIVPREVLELPKVGVLNLHPAYLPFNRGWHTPSWAILDDSPIGATLHFMDEQVDGGDILMQRSLQISPGDTADSLYQRLKQLELQVFQETWADIVSCAPRRNPQNTNLGSQHLRQELLQPDVQRIDLQQNTTGGELIRRLRALTTNELEESAYFEAEGRRFRIQVVIQEEK